MGNLDSAEVILDVGAADFRDSVRLARRCPNAKVYAFEPLPHNLEKYEQLQMKAEFPRIILIPKACGDHCADVEFTVSQKSAPPVMTFVRYLLTCLFESFS